MKISILLDGVSRSVFALLLLWQPLAYSVELAEELRFSGFVSQAAIHTSDNNYFGNSDDDVSLDYREVGAVLSVSVWENTHFSTLVLSRKAGHNSDGSLKVDHLLVNYNFLNSYDHTVGVRAGRLKSSYGWYNETRDVPFTRPGIFIAQSIYTDRVRNSYYFQDGIHLRGEHRFNLDTLSWHLGYHRPNVDEDEFVDVSPIPGIDETKSKDSWSAGLIYDYDAGKFRLGLFLEDKNFDEIFNDRIKFPQIGIPGTPFKANDLTIENLFRNFKLNNQRFVLSAEYNTERWSFVAELSRTFVDVDIDMNQDSSDVFLAFGSAEPFALDDPDLATSLPAEFANLTSLNFDQKVDSLAYYFQTIYRAGASWDILLRYDVFHFDEDKKNGKKLAEDFKFNFVLYPNHAYYAKDLTIGTGWYINPDWLVRFEWHYIDGTGWVTSADNPDRDDSSRYWNMIATQVSYRF